MPSFGFVIFIYSFLFITIQVFAQEPPLKPTGYFDRSEIILVWDEGTTNGAYINERNLKLKFNYQGFDEGERLSGGEKVTSDTVLSYDDRQIDVISGDFNDDNMADYLYSFTGDDDSLNVVLATRSNKLSFDVRNRYKLDGRILEGKNLIDGDLNGDGISEFVVGYRNFSDELAKVTVFGFDVNFQIKYYADIDDLTGTDNLVINLCDVDGNGDDELVIGYEESEPLSGFKIQVFDFDEDFNPISKAELKPDLNDGVGSFRAVAMTGLDYDKDGKDELVFAFNRIELDQPNNPDTYLYTAELMDNTETTDYDPLEKIEFYSDKYESGRYNYGHVWQILLKSGDLNNDGVPEIVLGCYRGVEIFQVLSDNQIEHVSILNEVKSFDEELSSINYFDVADMTGDDKADIVTADHFFSYEPDGDQYFTIGIYQFDSVLNSTVTEELFRFEQIDNGGGGGRNRTHYAISLSDFDGDLFRIGDYTSLGCFTDVVRPITVLNTPPVHIDLIDGTAHDVNECFGQNDCQSSVQKSTVEYKEEEYSFQQSSTGDWGYDPLVTAGVDFNEWGTGVSMSPIEISHFFGGDLEEVVVDRTTTSIGKTTNQSFFQTESMDKRYSNDDALLTMVNDYERWEYPVFNEYEEKLGEIVILIPKTINSENWLRGREVLEVSGLPRLHEPGNLLSYRKFYENPEDLKEVNPDIREIIAIANEHELDLASSYTESITWGKEFENKNVSVENVVETFPSYGISILGTQIGVEDASVAEEETIRSHTIKVGQNLGIEVHGSRLAGNSYEYKVKPYYYWSKNGALVVDYMVDLTGGDFWQQNYGMQDPGFIFPNRLDSLKAKNEIDKITDLKEYTKTPSIMFDPAIPVNGDTVNVTTIVHNLSLSPTDKAVEVSFYLGDPESGGTLISDIDGNTLFSTESIIGDQNYAMIEFTWLADFQQGDRMFAVLDPNDELAESKEDNNKAWTPVQRYAACGDAVDVPDIPNTSFSFDDRFQLYPNPAQNQVNLKYKGPFFSKATFVIRDVAGKVQQIGTLQYMGTSSEYTIDTESLNTGLYIVTVSTDNYLQMTKLMVE